MSNHIREDFSPGYYSGILIFLALILGVNFSLNLENGIIDAYTGRLIRIPMFFGLYAAVYYVACWLVSRSQKDWNFWSRKQFWMYSLFGLGVLSLDRGFPYLHQVSTWFSTDFDLYTWVYKVANHALSFVVVFSPLLLFYYWIDTNRSGFYGLTKSSNWRPYLILLLLIAPLIGLASLQPGFLSYYPMYKTNAVASLLGWPDYVPVLIFEFFYGADFINVELLFRGFFVIGLAQVLGRNAIIPMVTIYCALHFGKPLGEAISSIFGGYLLGIIAYTTRSIWGGILIHVGVAWLMELAAYTVKHF